MKVLKHLNGYVLAVAVFCSLGAAAQEKSIRSSDTIVIDPSRTFQVMRNFAASDAWAAQFVGNWPDAKKNAIADWLFSTDTFPNGNAKGIGLSMWRYNFGAASAEQGDSSRIKDTWRRAAVYNATGDAAKRIAAQNWFLQAAKQHGVQQFLGFFNSPPVWLTKNNKAYAVKGVCNISNDQLPAFADYAVEAITATERKTGIRFNYISPVNEPQWDWSDAGQEGCPYTNAEIKQTLVAFDKAFTKNKIAAKLLVTESGHYNYLLSNTDKHGKENQVYDFFNTSAANYIGNLASVSKTIAAHSYFSTSPFEKAIALRKKIADTVAAINGLEFWQSEYCILGDNYGEINGSKRDTGINAALYIAKVIHEDLVYANASAWQWWIAISPYNYKDGLVYIDRDTTDGNFYSSKMLWALGNYSRFIRPGMQRIDAATPSQDLLVTAYKNTKTKSTALVVVNSSDKSKHVTLQSKSGELYKADKKVTMYITSNSEALSCKRVPFKDLFIPSQSVVTILF